MGLPHTNLWTFGLSTGGVLVPPHICYALCHCWAPLRADDAYAALRASPAAQDISSLTLLYIMMMYSSTLAHAVGSRVRRAYFPYCSADNRADTPVGPSLAYFFFCNNDDEYSAVNASFSEIFSISSYSSHASFQ